MRSDHSKGLTLFGEGDFPALCGRECFSAVYCDKLQSSMPLLIVTGKPCTGKTTFAAQLVETLRNEGKTVELVNEESLLITKKDGYKTSFAEKATRGSLKGAVDHKLNAECFVVVDSLNYIKGYRYELYCAARTFRTPHCVVWVGCSDSTSSQWNQARLSSDGDGYDEKIMEDLRLRYEAPNESNRWDFPLFKVTVEPTLVDGVANLSRSATAEVSTATHEHAATPSPATSSFKSSWKPKKKPVGASAGGDDATVFTTATATSTATGATGTSQKAISFSGTMVVQEDTTITGFQTPTEVLPKILDYFAGASVPTPNSSTISVQRANADLLYELDRTSQQIIQTIVTHQSEGMAEGTPVKFVEFDRALTLNRHAGLAELQRYRRQFVKINGQHPPTSTKAIGSSFIDFLALHI